MAATLRKNLVGHIVKRSTVNPHAYKVQCLKLGLDKYLLKYFNKRSSYWALDPQKICDIGDIVVIDRLKERPTVQITHQIQSMMFKNGAVVDPITGKLCAGTKFVDMEIREKLLNKPS
ncbi:28S ribosomal protein S17, mitochondrial [Octopus vulgaris]|uniref:28S ribosomal protein S17, mitochondrial n=2 Tax=Octopus TaxID=6643 RepID=A0AA36AQM3_OCTVU|nr:28S ribosomal protein S17, mitochondrial [Octopus sinensis]CAI9719848.1 28S ribosomal protein S17, mitochondrial [Octopus vulgaris]